MFTYQATGTRFVTTSLLARGQTSKWAGDLHQRRRLCPARLWLCLDRRAIGVDARVLVTGSHVHELHRLLRPRSLLVMVGFRFPCFRCFSVGVSSRVFIFSPWCCSLQASVFSLSAWVLVNWALSREFIFPLLTAVCMSFPSYERKVKMKCCIADFPWVVSRLLFRHFRFGFRVIWGLVAGSKCPF